MRSGRWDGAKIELGEVNYRDVSMGVRWLKTGRLGQLRQGRGVFRAELLGLSARLARNTGELTSGACRNHLGDLHCQKDLDAFPRGRVTETVTAVASRAQFTATGLNDAADWYTRGTIRFLTGANATVEKEVKSSTALGVIALLEDFPNPIAINDTFIATVGCQRRYVEDCGEKFDTQINNRS